MKKILLAVGLLSIAGTTMAAGRSCDDVKADIDAKIKARGVASYTLDAVDKGSAADGKVVGTCEGGTKELVYKRG
ncbi:DUF1161 domain-containing protein [Pseudomonas bohemica]|uniref:DUF1161 domain-containing protein n=1 Tax=Pseudomonas bohemica TaxID=2044872 RepID=UPI000DA634D4|nr:DUF1161 domain-containing protein [Pseudomonas bohemica]